MFIKRGPTPKTPEGPTSQAQNPCPQTIIGEQNWQKNIKNNPGKNYSIAAIVTRLTNQLSLYAS